MRIIHLLLVAVAVLLSSGCAFVEDAQTGFQTLLDKIEAPAKETQAQPQPQPPTQAQIDAQGQKFATFVAGSAPLRADQGRIYFYRNTNMFGAFLEPPINLNGEVIGRSVSGGFFYKDVAPGDYVISTSSEEERHLKFTMSAKEVRYVRTSLTIEIFMGRVVNPRFVPVEEAQQELADLRYAPYVPQAEVPRDTQSYDPDRL